jgi:hypothetical protein
MKNVTRWLVAIAGVLALGAAHAQQGQGGPQQGPRSQAKKQASVQGPGQGPQRKAQMDSKQGPGQGPQRKQLKSQAHKADAAKAKGAALK